MVIKSKDDVEPAIKALLDVLASPSLSQKQKELVEDEIGNVRAGARGEKETAYHIDFQLKDAKNYAIIHDLRLEHNGRVAQIDHLIIGRFFDIILIESKNFGTEIRITEEEEFQVKTRYGWRGMGSPVEQSKRHAFVLGEMIADLKLTPKRLGFQISPTFHHWVLVPPECNVTRQSKEAKILKMDMFGKHMEEWINSDSGSGILALAKVASRETITELASALVRHHQPISINFAAKFGISPPIDVKTTDLMPSIPQTEEAPPVLPEAIRCEGCQTPLEEKVISFCKKYPKKFDGRLLCGKCQPQNTPTAPALAAAPSCVQCGTVVESSVVAFCRFNSSRFGKRLLCRPCQGAVIEAR